ncbi:hypothetical protein AJ79_07163 [Helicocarpus griseus UAMH5409]|uniref:Uncharacterized protein n=1 Tax=Helicocarpus griseus UAMH5409 TaxID=1447875 RepID=A0A2B7X5G3_9EURO|nr:hypothetical protein AJ79_07163 [Helicocarpus griseus UAMH5409]
MPCEENDSMIKLLLGRGADIEEKGRHPLFRTLWEANSLYEAVLGFPDQFLTRLLIENGANINFVDGISVTVLYQLLLEKGASVHSRNITQCTPLHYAARGKPEVIRLLLQYGADIEAKTALGRTPLHIAAKHSAENTKELIQRGAEMEAKNNYGKPPLHVALHSRVNRYEKGTIRCEVVQVLIENGADIEAR